MAKEQAASTPQPRPKLAPLTDNRTPPASAPSVPLSTSATSWRPLSASKTSLASIQSEQSVRTPVSSRAPQPLPRQASAPAVVASPSASRPMASGSTYTPTRMPSGSASGSATRSTPKGGFGAADIPWTNYTFAPPSSAPASVSPAAVDPFLPSSASSPRARSFAAIQSQQRAEVAAIKEVKAPRSFAEVMAREQEEARQREEDERRAVEEAEFAKWFEAEARRVQGMMQAPEFVPKSGGESSPGGGRGGARGARGGSRGGRGGAGSSGGGRGGKKTATSGDAKTAAEGNAHRPKQPKANRGRGGNRGGGKASQSAVDITLA